MTNGYVDLKYEPKATDLVCEFKVKSKLPLKKAAEHIAAESSTGTWVDVLTAPPYLRNLSAKVFYIKKPYVRIAYPIELFEPGNMPNILSSVAGNIFGMKVIDALRLEDIQWPLELKQSFKGPLFGMEGVRKIVGVKDRPLCGTIVKPKLGLNANDHARVAYEAWVGGCDVVKDDENLSNQKFNKFEERVEATLKAKEKAERETGEKKLYLANVTAETNEMLKRAKYVKDLGGESIMVDVITAGWSALQTLRDANDDLRLILHGHRAMHAAFTRNPDHGISMLVIADVCKLIGIDQLHIGTIYGKMEGGKREVVLIEEEIEMEHVGERFSRLSEYWGHIKPMFAVCSGGLHPGHVEKLVKTLGKSIIIQAGGGIHGHPGGTIAGAKAMRQAIDAVMEGYTLKEYAKTHKELAEALRYFSKKK